MSMYIRTPLLELERGIFLKPENLQPFGSYKIRGVARAIEVADPVKLKEGLSAASAGNMAQAVAFAAKTLGTPCRIFAPTTAPQIKKDAIRALGAELVELSYEDLWKLVNRQSPTPARGVFIHPIHTPGLLEGYASIADEILADAPDAEDVILPFGVGGLSLGVARRLKELKPGIRIHLCETETAAPMRASLEIGEASRIAREPSFIDAIGTPEVLPEVFQALRPLVEGSLVVSLDETRHAITELATKKKLVCEGAAAAALAAARQLPRDRKKVCVLTGGNLPREILVECLVNYALR